MASAKQTPATSPQLAGFRHSSCCDACARHATRCSPACRVRLRPQMRPCAPMRVRAQARLVGLAAACDSLGRRDDARKQHERVRHRPRCHRRHHSRHLRHPRPQCPRHPRHPRHRCPRHRRPRHHRPRCHPRHRPCRHRFSHACRVRLSRADAVHRDQAIFRANCLLGGLFSAGRSPPMPRHRGSSCGCSHVRRRRLLPQPFLAASMRRIALAPSSALPRWL